MTAASNKKIGELLCDNSHLQPTELDVALGQQREDPRPIGEILLDLGYISRGQLNEGLALQAGIERVNVAAAAPDPALIDLVSAELVNKHAVLPLARANGQLQLAMADPFDRQAIEDVQVVTGLRIRRFFADMNDLERAILKFYGSNVARMLNDLTPTDAESDTYNNGDFSPAKLHELAREPSLVNLLNIVLLEAIEAQASDVHIEPFEDTLKIKYRIDGQLVEKSPASKRFQAGIISRIKVMADMNIAERFVPQDGHIEFTGPRGKVDLRVSTVPTVFGESVTLRILDRSASLISLEDLGLNQQSLDGFNLALAQAHGLILVTGPTGSGKTTTLYAALNKIYSPAQKIITIEDPVEYQLHGIIQMPVNPKRGLTFATGLRHILRQDPDIVMVGEIRDRDTADVAIRAALTGHLVFSTLHTNDAAGAVTRLIDMGLEPFLLANSLEAVLAQRLVRRICPHCKQRYHADDSLTRTLNNSIKIERDVVMYHGTGCDECNQTGMRGRTGIFELLRITEALRQLIPSKPTTEQIAKHASDDHLSMRHDGVTKVLAGITTPEEVLRVTQGVDDE